MKKSSLYFIYGLLFVILSNVADNRIIAGLTAICAVVFMITSLALGYLEDKYK